MNAFLMLTFTKFTEPLAFEDNKYHGIFCIFRMIFLSVYQVTIGNRVVTRALAAFS